MLKLFMADPDAVRLKVSPLGPGGCGPYGLTIEHAGGELVEYFSDVTQALMREDEVDTLVTTARWLARSEWTGGSYARRSKRRSGFTASVFCASDVH